MSSSAGLLAGSRTDEPVSGRLARLAAAVDEVAGLDLDGLDGDELLDHQRAFETLGRRVDALATRVAGRVDQSRAYGLDGHMNAAAFLRHAGQVSGGEARGRVQASRALRDLPQVAAAYNAGKLSTDQVRLFARVWANPRVRASLPLSESPLLANARVSSYAEFSTVIREWERLVDTDGAADRNDAAHRRRTFNWTQNFDGSWTLAGTLSAAAGAAFSDVMGHFVDLENEVDWDKARAEHGNEACYEDLPRTAPQRRADALFHLAQTAATAAPGRNAGDPLTSIVMDHKTFDEELARLAGETVKPDLSDFDKRRCSTMTGHWIHPRDGVLAALYDKVRRVVIGASGAVIDLGRASRFFTGNARDAALLANPTCTHPGCEIPGQLCEADHINEWSKHGPTNATTNGNPRCGFHNKLKNHGYRTWRDTDGTWYSTRPDGTPIH